MVRKGCMAFKVQNFFFFFFLSCIGYRVLCYDQTYIKSDYGFG